MRRLAKATIRHIINTIDFPKFAAITYHQASERLVPDWINRLLYNLRFENFLAIKIEKDVGIGFSCQGGDEL